MPANGRWVLIRRLKVNMLAGSGTETARHGPLWGLREGGMENENQKIAGENSTSSDADNSYKWRSCPFDRH